MLYCVQMDVKDFNVVILIIYAKLLPNKLTYKLRNPTSSLKMTKNWGRNMLEL
jgi:hypothetical protein